MEFVDTNRWDATDLHRKSSRREADRNEKALGGHDTASNSIKVVFPDPFWPRSPIISAPRKEPPYSFASIVVYIDVILNALWFNFSKANHTRSHLNVKCEPRPILNKGLAHFRIGHNAKFGAFDALSRKEISTCGRSTVIVVCVRVFVFLYTYTNTSIFTCIVQTCIHTCIHACMHTYMHTCMHTYIHACIHTCTHTYKK